MVSGVEAVAVDQVARAVTAVSSTAARPGVMAGFVPPRLANILGHELDGIDAAGLRRLTGVEESDALDFKSAHYGANDEAKRELAADLAAFANAVGGC
jgi:hypothetical protein